MLIRNETSYYLPPEYYVKHHRGLLMLHRPGGSVVETFNQRRAIGEIIERYAWEDSFKRGNSGLGRHYERFLELPVPMVLGIMWLLGILSIGSCVVVLLYVWMVLC